MKEDWKECKLGEVLTIKYGKNQKEVESPNGTIPIYGTGGLMGYATKFLYDKPSILIGRKGTINKVKFIDKPFWTVDTLFYLWTRESVKMRSVAEHFHTKPPAMRVEDKNL